MNNNINKIPVNLTECFEVLDEVFSESEEDKSWFASSIEEEAVGSLHHNLGAWVRKEWGLWEKKSDIYNVFAKMDIWHADDMSSIILTCYHRRLNGKELKLSEQVQEYIQYWKNYEKLNGPIDK